MNRNDHNFSNPILINLPVALFASVTLTLAPRAGAVCQQGYGDPAGTPQFGLVAEQVETVDPDLIVRCNDQATTKRIQALSASLKEQASQTEKVSNQLALSKAPSQLISSQQ